MAILADGLFGVGFGQALLARRGGSDREPAGDQIVAPVAVGNLNGVPFASEFADVC